MLSFSKYTISSALRNRLLNKTFVNGIRRYGSAKHEEEHPFTDGEAKPFGLEKTDPVDWNRRFYITFYLGGIALFVFLYQYVPDTSYKTIFNQIL